ncbi:hypothetical protein PYCCODRAFT_1495651 [Trametes coccinea BRFM310]|uniref:Uncharacterized protein n=1 Tax=Trametes coccinea (strain BRFM310) TaxID=1353009 RepID=A0A1Y2IQH7_TRAC3|nr:hypothetical protein PYCCODRAFT_1495651 [Trametes coccinea BRFM310]
MCELIGSGNAKTILRENGHASESQNEIVIVNANVNEQELDQKRMRELETEIGFRGGGTLRRGYMSASIVAEVSHFPFTAAHVTSALPLDATPTSMDKLTIVRNSLLHGHALPEDMSIGAREFITHTLQDVETMEFGDGEDFSSSVCSHIQDQFHPRNLLDAFSIAHTGLAVRSPEESIVNKILRLATLSAYVACNIGLRDCLDEIEVAAGIKKGTDSHEEKHEESSAVQPRHASPDVIPAVHYVAPIAPAYDTPNTILMRSSPSTHVTPPAPTLATPLEPLCSL